MFPSLRRPGGGTGRGRCQLGRTGPFRKHRPARPRPTPRTPARPITSAGESVTASSRVASYCSTLTARSRAERGDASSFYGHKRRLAQVPRIIRRWKAGKDDIPPPFHRQRWTCPRKTLIVQAGSLNLTGAVWSPGERRAGRRGAAVSDRLGTAGQGCAGRRS